MELVKNKASGKFFVVLDDAGISQFLVITPAGKVKCLSRHLFESYDDLDLKTLQWRHYITEKQMDTYVEYHGGDDLQY
ncbi:hypothetical protein DSCA_51230 [Desulfosarcina alkanivorans]|uniref:Uncharacterized protein n=1 Tax=Desulfosarcina alkanivorans TaxID=571177 RepID=A0A5K7YSR6_9BACT|nr:hypothetical protein [Desulfosarcina alkanivorans]BBO71193.1 hypothetical protein DSCA_51230 [Desulfosarcina alkanivorans]